MNCTDLTIEERSCIPKYYVHRLRVIEKLLNSLSAAPAQPPVKSDATALTCMTFLHTTLHSTEKYLLRRSY